MGNSNVNAMMLDNMSTPNREISLNDALSSIAPPFRQRLLKAYNGLKTAFIEGNFDTCGLRAGRFCEVLLRWAQNELTGTYVPFGRKIPNFKLECDRLD